MLLGEETPVWGGIVARFRDIDGNSFALVSFDELTHAMAREPGVGPLDNRCQCGHTTLVSFQCSSPGRRNGVNWRRRRSGPPE